MIVWLVLRLYLPINKVIATYSSNIVVAHSSNLSSKHEDWTYYQGRNTRKTTPVVRTCPNNKEIGNNVSKLIHLDSSKKTAEKTRKS